jgi:hypothetical protein
MVVLPHNLIKSQLADNYTFNEPHIGYREVTEINIDCINGNRTIKHIHLQITLQIRM